MSTAYDQLPKHLRDAIALNDLKKIAASARAGSNETARLLKAGLNAVGMRATQPRIDALFDVVREQRTKQRAIAKKHAKSIIRLGDLLKAKYSSRFWQVMHTGDGKGRVADTKPRVRQIRSKAGEPLRNTFTGRAVNLNIAGDGTYLIGRYAADLLPRERL